MLVHPWNGPVDKDDWRRWLSQGRDFGQLASVGNEWPVVVPTHFVVDGDEVLVHLARPNPIWSSIEATGRAVLSVLDDYAYIPTYWRTGTEDGETAGVPTSYHSVVQLRCRAELVDDPAAKAELLRKQCATSSPRAGTRSRRCRASTSAFWPASEEYVSASLKRSRSSSSTTTSQRPARVHQRPPVAARRQP